MQPLNDSWIQHDAVQNKARTETDRNRAKHLASLYARARTNSQKTAVATFDSTIATIITVHRNALGNALTNYRTGVKKIYQNRAIALQNLSLELHRTVGQALMTAKVACTTNKAGKVTEQALQESIRGARENFKKKESSLPNVRTEIITLRTKYIQSVQLAQNSFNSALAQAGLVLEKALGGALPQK
jgi:hypothetical protein